MIKILARFWILQLFMYGLMGYLVFGFFETQVTRGTYYRSLGDRNRIRAIRTEAPRGDILDRNGLLLAATRPSFNVYIIPEDFDPGDMHDLTRLLEMSEDDLRKRMSGARNASFSPVLLRQDIPKRLAMEIEEHRPGISGVFIQVKALRYYPHKKVAAHLLGYVGKITREEYDRLDRSVYAHDSWIGRSGIERAFDGTLRGEDGGRQLEVNARGVPVRIISERESVSGQDVKLTLDARLSYHLRALLSRRNGSILVMDVNSGGILAALSVPDFDPNAFVVSGRNEERLELIGSKERPLINRGFDGRYPPGSVFKLVTAMAALEHNLITPHTTFHCPGHFSFGGKSRRFKCWFHQGHGSVDLFSAIERSCNVYFYNIGRLLGEKRLADYTRKLGFGVPVDLELPNSGGLVPDAGWKWEKFKEPWYGGETITFAIGQGFLLVTPLQVLRLVQAIATDGKIVEPTLLLEEAERRSKSHTLDIRPDIFRPIKQGMLQVVESKKGTGQLARVNFNKLAGKTGSAQAPPGAAHAWFGGFFPYDNPKIALVIMVERGQSGGIAGARIAKQVLRIWNEIYGPQVS